VVHYSLLCAMIVIWSFNLLYRSMSSFRDVRRTAVHMPMLRGSWGGIFRLQKHQMRQVECMLTWPVSPISVLKQTSCLPFNS